MEKKCPAQSIYFRKAPGYCAYFNEMGFILFLPSKAIDKESDRKGAKDATNREDRDSNGPDGREGDLGDGLIVALNPRLIDEVLNYLPR